MKFWIDSILLNQEACLVYGKFLKGTPARNELLFSNWTYLNGRSNPY